MKHSNSRETNNKQGRNKRKNKRKANSPLEIQSGQSSVELLSTRNTSSFCVDSFKRYCLPPDYSTVVAMYNQGISTGASPGANYTQPFGFGFQPQTPFTPNTAISPTHGSNLTPEWAKQLVEDIKFLKNSASKIETTVNNINTKVASMETKVNALETKVNDIETSCTFINSEFENQKKKLETANIEITNIQQTMRNLEKQTERLLIDKEKCNEKITDLESRSMRENLIFYGIAETGNGEDCEALVKTLIQTTMGLDTSTMQFDRVHRLGGDLAKKPRGIAAKFHYFKDREKVRKRSYDEDVKQKLREANCGVGVQRPLQNRVARKAFLDIIKSETTKGKTVRQNGNKLYVNGRLHKVFIDGNVIDPPAYITGEK